LHGGPAIAWQRLDERARPALRRDVPGPFVLVQKVTTVTADGVSDPSCDIDPGRKDGYPTRRWISFIALVAGAGVSGTASSMRGCARIHF